MITIIVALIMISAWAFVIYEIVNAPEYKDGKFIKRKKNEKAKKDSL
jgi:hypothetical protein